MRNRISRAASLMSVLIAAGVVAVVRLPAAPAAPTDDVPWDRIGDARALNAAQRAVAEEVLRDAPCYGACEGVILDCLLVGDGVGTRLANFVARRAGQGYSAASILKSVANRKLSAHPPETFDVDLSGLVPSGSADAPVRVVIYADFECAHCRVAATGLRELSLEMPEAMSLTFKNYPLTQSPRAVPAALVYLAAERQGMGWEMHDRLYAHVGDLDDESLEVCAVEAGVALEQYYADIQSVELRRRIDAEKAEGVACGVRSTPGILINGKPFRGIKTKVELRDRIEEELGMVGGEP